MSDDSEKDDYTITYDEEKDEEVKVKRKPGRPKKIKKEKVLKEDSPLI